MGHQVRVYPVFPLPSDLAESNIEPFVMAAEEDYEIWQVIVLVDLHWEHGGMGETGTTMNPTTEWRATRAIDFQLTAHIFIRQMGLSAFCGVDLEFCEILVRGTPWTHGTLQFDSGEYVVVKVKRTHSTIPLGTQWQLSNEGCNFEDMYQRLGPPSNENRQAASNTRRENATPAGDEGEMGGEQRTGTEGEDEGDLTYLMQAPGGVIGFSCM